MTSEKKERDEKIKEYYQSDEQPSLRQVGEKFGISHERVSQILNKKFDISTSRNNDKYSRNDVINVLQRYYEENGEPPKRSEWEKKPSVSTISRKFDGWEYALLAAGLKLPRQTSRRKYKRDELIELLNDANKRVEGDLTYKKFNNMPDMPSGETIRRYFGSWNRGKTAAGISVFDSNEKANGYDDINVLMELKNIVQKEGKITKKEWDENYAPPSSNTIKKVFGSWSNAMYQVLSDHSIPEIGSLS